MLPVSLSAGSAQLKREGGYFMHTVCQVQVVSKKAGALFAHPLFAHPSCTHLDLATV